MCVKLFYISLNESESSTTLKLAICITGHVVRYISTNKCAGIVGCSFYIFELNRSINSKWQLLGYASIEFSEHYIPKPLQLFVCNALPPKQFISSIYPIPFLRTNIFALMCSLPINATISV